jgi:hypothetical protein
MTNREEIVMEGAEKTTKACHHLLWWLSTFVIRIEEKCVIRMTLVS